MGIFGRKRTSEPPTPPQQVVQVIQDAARERSNKLHELDLLMSIDSAERTVGQSQRLQQIQEELWPGPEYNPMNGFRRVPGGHGFGLHRA